MNSAGKGFSHCSIYFVTEKFLCCSIVAIVMVGTIVISFSRNNGNNIFVYGKHHFFPYSQRFSSHIMFLRVIQQWFQEISGFSNSMMIDLLKDGASSSRGLFVTCKSKQADRESHIIRHGNCNKLPLWDGTLGTVKGLLPLGWKMLFCFREFWHT